MCSYNLINGTYACENNNTINGILKDELGFQGFVMSDWSAQHSTISAMTGLDMTMPGDITFDSNTSYYGANLTSYVDNGTIPEARVDDMATRILAIVVPPRPGLHQITQRRTLTRFSPSG